MDGKLNAKKIEADRYTLKILQQHLSTSKSIACKNLNNINKQALPKYDNIKITKDVRQPPYNKKPEIKRYIPPSKRQDPILDNKSHIGKYDASNEASEIILNLSVVSASDSLIKDDVEFMEQSNSLIESNCDELISINKNSFLHSPTKLMIKDHTNKDKVILLSPDNISAKNLLVDVPKCFNFANKNNLNFCPQNSHMPQGNSLIINPAAFAESQNDDKAQINYDLLFDPITANQESLVHDTHYLHLDNPSQECQYPFNPLINDQSSDNLENNSENTSDMNQGFYHTYNRIPSFSNTNNNNNANFGYHERIVDYTIKPSNYCDFSTSPSSTKSNYSKNQRVDSNNTYNNPNSSHHTRDNPAFWSTRHHDEDSSTRYNKVIEISGFPASFNAMDIKDILLSTGDMDMEILWVDDNHALAIFSSQKFAQDALTISHPLMKCKTFEHCSAKSKAKADKCLDKIIATMISSKPRPQTTIVIARRFIEGHLGKKANTDPALRNQQMKQYKEAVAEKKRVHETSKPDMWDEATD